MKKHLKNQYGFNKFRDCQKDIIKDTLKGKDTMVIFPTGGGKSLCYQFPATYLNKKSIVVSPLISLMTDQQKHLEKRGIKAICLNGESNIPGRSLLSKNNASPDTKGMKGANVVYCTPEYITTHIGVFKSISKDICLFAIDEAHCLSEWGHDFRPSYHQLALIRKEFKSIPIMALTATATPQVLDDIFSALALSEATQYQLETIRDNLSIYVREKSGDIMEDLDIDPEESTIIYTQTRKNAEKICNLLNNNGIKAGCYHAGMSSEKKHKTHTLFVNDKIKVIVATICFGMGIDKPDIRKVINYGSPCNLETYYQEIGRAGRDGMPSTVIMYYDSQDYNTNRFLLSKSSEEQYSIKIKLLNTFQKYITNHKHCRQQMIEYYFTNGNIKGRIPEDGKCGICDNCKGVTKVLDKSDVLGEAKLVIGVVKSLPVNYGVNKIIKILKGTGSMSGNRYYSMGRYKSVDWWKKLINVLVNEDYLDKKPYGYYTVIGLGDKELGDELNLYIPSETSKKGKGSKKYEKIRDRLAKSSSVPSYMIVNDKVLSEISLKKPKNITELFNVDGVSTEFIAKFGSFFITEEKKKKVKKEKKESTADISWSMYSDGKSISQIAQNRGLKPLTIESHIIKKFSENPENIDMKRIDFTPDIRENVAIAVSKVGKGKLRPIKEFLENIGFDISYFHIKIALIFI